MTPPAPALAYDARFSIGSYRGMGRFTRCLIRNCARDTLGLVATGESDPDLKLLSGGFHSYPLWEQLSLPRRTARSNVKYLLCPYNTAPLFLPRNIFLILVVHDLIFMQPVKDLPLSQSAYQNFGRVYRRWVVPSAIRRANALITVSEFSRREILHSQKNIAAPITVIPNTIDESWFASSSPRPESQEIILCPSGGAPSKNLATALRGFAEFWQSHQKAQLVVTGVTPSDHAPFQSLAASLGVGSQVVFRTYMREDELQSLYRSARLALLPSLQEGFGIPALESAAIGLPVVCSAIPAFEEVLGDSALFFNPLSPSDIARTLCRAWPHDICANLSAKGIERAKLFHPAIITDKIRAFWEQTLCAC